MRNILYIYDVEVDNIDRYPNKYIQDEYKSSRQNNSQRSLSSLCSPLKLQFDIQVQEVKYHYSK